MKLSSLALLLVGASLWLVVLVNCDDSRGETSDIIETARGQFRLPKLFNFARFKEIFNKSYATLLDELVRKKLFLARTFESFISLVSYKHKKASSFASINQMSDWTNGEWRQTLIKPEVYYDSVQDLPVSEDMAQFLMEQVGKNKMIVDEDQSTSETDESPLADTEQIKRKFAEIVENPDSKVGYREIADELVKQSQSGETKMTFIDLDPFIERETLSEPDSGAAVGLIGHLGGKLNYKSVMNFVSETLSTMLAYFDLAIESAFVWAVAKRPAKSDLPDEVFHDHRQSGCLNSVRDQGACGSCFIFSTIAMYEWAYCRQYGTKIKFSEQYVLDCAKERRGFYGCEGGIVPAVGRFVQQFGFELRDRYKYRASQQECPFNQQQVDGATNGMGFVRLNRSRMRFVPYNKYEDQLKKSPFMIAIRTGMDFFQYGGGVHYNNKCGPRDELHSVLLVGSGRQDGYEYWLIRNSHGSYWGEKGYYKMRKGSNCLGTLGFGFIMEPFRPDFLPDSIGDELPPLVDLFQANGVAEYNFSENSRYDWRILAKRFGHKSAPQLPGKERTLNKM